MSGRFGGTTRLDGSVGLPILLSALALVVLTVAPFPQNALLVAAGAAFVVAAVSPPIALGALVASVPFQDIGRESLGPVNLTMTKVLLLSIALSWFFRVVSQRKTVHLDRLAVAYGIYVVVLGLSIVNAPDSTFWGTELYRWWSPLLAYVIAINTIREPSEGQWIVIGTAGGVLAASIYGFVQVLKGIGPESFNVNGFQRVYSTFGQPNPFAGYLCLTVPFLTALVAGWLLAVPESSGRRLFSSLTIVLAGLSAGFGLVALVLTQSRGGWLGMSAGLAVVAWLLGPRMRLAAAGVGVAMLLFVVATPFGARMADRLFEGAGLQSEQVLVTPRNFAVQERLAHWRAGIAMVKQYPYFGVGAGNYSARFREFTPEWRFRISRGHAHNAYVHVAAQSGLIGLTAYFIFIGGVASKLLGDWRAAASGPVRLLVIGAVGVSVAFAIHNVFDYLHVLSLPVQLSAIWALAGTSVRMATLPGPDNGSIRFRQTRSAFGVSG